MVYASRYLRLEKPFMKGPDVMLLQELLNKHSYPVGITDGIFGGKTAEALISFQLDNSLNADGITGPQIWQLLNNNNPGNSIFQVELQFNPSITVDVDQKRLYYFSANLKKTYKVAVGKARTPSPLGSWNIVQKTVDPGGPFGVRWMRLNVPWGGYGIHGTNNPKSIGKAASHGCIRMYNNDVIELYGMTPLGTAVIIIGRSNTGRVLSQGSSGSDVQSLQRRLKSLGLYKYSIDGFFAARTEQAVIALQKSAGLTPDGIVGPATYNALQKALDIRNNDSEP